MPNETSNHLDEKRCEAHHIQEFSSVLSRGCRRRDDAVVRRVGGAVAGAGGGRSSVERGAKARGLLLLALVPDEVHLWLDRSSRGRRGDVDGSGLLLLLGQDVDERLLLVALRKLDGRGRH